MVLNKLLCWLWSHKLEVVNTYCEGICQKLYCTRCKRYFGINHSVRAFVDWDSELEFSMKLDEKIEKCLSNN